MKNSKFKIFKIQKPKYSKFKVYFSPTAFRLGVPISLPGLYDTAWPNFGEVILGSMSYIGRREFFTFHYTFLLELSFTATAKSTEVVWKIPNSKFEIQNLKFKSKFQNSKFKFQNIQYSKFKFQNSKFKIQSSKFKMPFYRFFPQQPLGLGFQSLYPGLGHLYGWVLAKWF